MRKEARPMTDTRDLAARLAQHAESLCRHYLSNGRKSGRYWLVGNIDNAPGRSLYVRLLPGETGPAGKWSDAATGEHGDLLDIIARRSHLMHFAEVAEEAQRFLHASALCNRTSHRRTDTTAAARILFEASRPISGTLAQTYLQARRLTSFDDLTMLRFHPRCWIRTESASLPKVGPALIAGVTDCAGKLTGVQRTYLARDGSRKAALTTPRRSLGRLAGGGVRIGYATDIAAAGEGLETMLSLREVLPSLPVIACLSASNLGALIMPGSLTRLYIARDNDAAGHAAANKLAARAFAQGIEATLLTPMADDFNSDLVISGADALRAQLRRQLTARDADRLL
jgi:phage/plasmid primase-like uncharacterized protein